MNTAAVDIYAVLLAAKRKAMFEPEWFLREILHQDPDPWQIQGLEAVADVQRYLRGMPTVVNHEGLSRITIRSLHGPGKTHFLGFIMHWATFCFYIKLVCTAPKEKQLKTRLWPRFRKILNEADSNYKQQFLVNATDIVINGDPDWGCVAETASDPDNLSGYHDDPQFFLVDEASAKRLEPMFPAIEGALSTVGSTLVMIGNPTRMDGEFYNSHNKVNVKKLYFQMHIKAEDSRFVDAKWVKAMREKYGIESPIYLVRAKGEFASFDEAILVHPELIEEALNSDWSPDGSHPILKISIDVADGGADSTVITVCKHFQSFIVLLKQQAFWFEAKRAPILAAKKAIEFFEAFDGDTKNGDVFIPDANGVGSGTAGYLMEQVDEVTGEAYYNVIPFVGGQKANNPVRFRNKRVECSILLQEKLADHTFLIAEGAVDDEEELRAHWLSIKRNDKSEKLDDIEPKRKIKEALLPSPDRWDSTMQQMVGKSSTSMIPTIIPEVFGEMESTGDDGGLI